MYFCISLRWNVFFYPKLPVDRSCGSVGSKEETTSLLKSKNWKHCVCGLLGLAWVHQDFIQGARGVDWEVKIAPGGRGKKQYQND